MLIFPPFGSGSNTKALNIMFVCFVCLGMILQFLSEVDWGDVEYLVIDTPPGTSDEHLSAAQYLLNAGLTGAIIVTTPQEVSLLDVRKEIDFCHKTKIPILGVVENMTTFVCPKCKVSNFIL